jgi:hypothetical protein
MKHRVFIASSVEGLSVAYAIQENLDHEFEITVWPQGVFELSKSALESLIEQSKRFDAAVFVFTPDDKVLLRNEQKPKARDNVVFELGLFIGILGKDKCFLVKPRSFSNLDFPSDLLGMTPADYSDDRSDGNLCAALGPSSNKIRRALSSKVGEEKKKAHTLEELLLSRPYRLFFNPDTKRSKRIVFSSDGLIVEGNNRNEHSWRVKNDLLELVQLDKRIHSRFAYNKTKDIFEHTNESDTLSIRGQFIVPDVPAGDT